MGIVKAAKKVAGVASSAGAAYELLVKVEGKPVREKGKPAKVLFCGWTVFERDEDGKQHVAWFRIRDARPNG